MNFVSIVEGGFRIEWRCDLHQISGFALGPLGNGFDDYQKAITKNYCPRCSNLDPVVKKLEHAFKDGKIPKR